MKSGYAVLAGCPNVGKSTLMNSLIGQKIAITSNRPQTTRTRIETVYTDNRGQIVFLDTPGIHQAKTKLEKYMEEALGKAFRDADLVCFAVAPEAATDADLLVAERIAKLNRMSRPVMLIINKTDTLRTGEEKGSVLEIAAGFLDLMKKVLPEETAEGFSFCEVMPVSAKTGEGLSALLDAVFRYMPEGPMYFDEETVTTESERDIASEMIREQLLEFLGDEVPHRAAVVIECFKERDKGPIDIEADIILEKESHKGIVIGRNGSMLRKIGTAARKEIAHEFSRDINLRLFVKVRKNWTKSDTFLSDYGYDLRKL